jgi:5'-nucleotidase
VAELVRQAEARTAPLVNQVIGESSIAITRTQAASGESALGNLIADAQRAATGSDFSFMNPGGVRADLDAGPITWGELFTIQPFGNSLVRMDLTGEQVRTLLEQQWVGQTSPRLLQISGLRYTWDAAAPDGAKVIEITKDGIVLDPAAIYSVTVNSFIAAGGDNFSVLVDGTNRVGGDVDLDALITYVTSLSQPIVAQVEGRITRVN